MADFPQVFCHISRRINLGNYNHMDITMGLSGVPSGADQQFIEEMLGTVKITFDVLRTELKAKVEEAKRDAGGETPPPANTPAYAEAFRGRQ